MTNYAVELKNHSRCRFHFVNESAHFRTRIYSSLIVSKSRQVMVLCQVQQHS